MVYPTPITKMMSGEMRKIILLESVCVCVC